MPQLTMVHEPLKLSEPLCTGRLKKCYGTVALGACTNPEMAPSSMMTSASWSPGAALTPHTTLCRQISEATTTV